MTRFTICDDEPEHGRLIGKYIKTEYAKHVPETDIAEVVVYQSPQEMLDEAIEVQTMYNIMNFLREKKKILVIEKGDIIRLSDIVSVNVIKHDLIFKSENGERKIRANLSTYEEQLKQFGFIKISQGEMVNKDYIRERKKDNFIMKDGTVYHISRSRVDEIRRMFI